MCSWWYPPPPILLVKVSQSKELALYFDVCSTLASGLLELVCFQCTEVAGVFAPSRVWEERKTSEGAAQTAEMSAEEQATS